MVKNMIRVKNSSMLYHYDLVKDTQHTNLRERLAVAEETIAQMKAYLKELGVTIWDDVDL
jgi:hypothetical protein